MELSVQFFKRLIIGLLAALILIPTILSVCLGLSARRANAQVELLQAQQAQSASAVKTRPPTDPAFPMQTDTAHTVQTGSVTPLPYQTLYENLYSNSFAPDQWQRQENTVYLTFDGGPSAQTAKILDILDEAGVKATFFVLAAGNESYYDLLRDIVDRGHTLGIHSYSSDYREIYQSVEAYLADFQSAYRLIADRTATAPCVFRFPGGSINAYNGGIYQQLIAEMTRRGFTYYDWDVVGDIPVGSAQTVTNAVLDGVRGKSSPIVLLHDAQDKRTTTDALAQILADLKAQGYAFAPLTPQVEPIRFNYTR